MHYSDEKNITDFGICQVGTHTDEVLMLKSTTLGGDEKDEATMSMVADNRIKTGMPFADIVRGNQSLKSVARVTLSYLTRRRICPRRSRSRGSNLHVGSCI